MQITHPIARFLASEDGAVTVDWVVLAAALVALAVAVAGLLNDEVDAILTEVQTDLNAATNNDVTLADN
jgi:Flp pilus assembly pilin Flp